MQTLPTHDTQENTEESTINRRTAIVAAIGGLATLSLVANTQCTSKNTLTVPEGQYKVGAGKITGKVNQIEIGKGYIFNVKNNPNTNSVLVFRLNTEQFHALDTVCTHWGCPVNLFDEKIVRCVCHGSEFSPDGKVTKGPASSSLTKFPVTLEGENFIIDLNKPEKLK